MRLRTLPVAQRLAGSDAVFVGEVLQHEPLRSVDLLVLDTYKGEVGRRITIPSGYSLCDYFLDPEQAQPGQRFLIYMSRQAGRVSVNRCLGSAPLSASTSALEYLQAHRPAALLQSLGSAKND